MFIILRLILCVVFFISSLNYSRAEENKIVNIKETQLNTTNNDSSQDFSKDKQGKKINLQEILEFTFNNNDTLQAEREKTKAVEALKFKTIGANALPNVGVDLNYGYTDFKQDFSTLKIENDGKLVDNKIYLQQPLFKSGRTITQVKSVNSQIAMQHNKLDDTEQTILFNAIQATTNLLKSKKIYEITQQNEESLKNNYEYVLAKNNVGRAVASDVSLAMARYSSAKSDTIIANKNYMQAKINFSTITKINADEIEVDYEDIFNKTFNYEISMDKILESSLQKNPSYQIAKNNYEMNKSNLNYARTNFLPEIYLNAQISDANTADIINQKNSSVSVNFKIPLFQSGTEYASQREAGHLLNESKFNLNDTKEALLKQTTNTFSDFMSSKSLVSSSKANLDATKISLDSITMQEKVGKSTIIDILDRRKEYYDAEIKFINFKNDVITYYYQLKFLMGELNLTYLFNKDN